MIGSLSGKRGDILFSVLFWITAFVLYFIFRKVGLDAEVGIEINDPLSVVDNITLSVLIGGLTGIIYYFLERIFDRSVIQRQSLGIQLIIRTICYLLLINFLAQIALSLQYSLIKGNESYSLIDIWSSPALWPFILYFMLWSDLYYFIKLVNQKFGKGVLLKMLMGKYRNPRIENKIFLFIDLKSSTELAEKLGYMTYSKLIQQCFYDLNEIVLNYQGEVYQYVGDEAVICWDYDQGIKDNRCIECFLSFVNALIEKQDKYRELFGVVPQFKAGIHGGELVVTEVGIIKKEIAYHGDVINTTARIQEKCNEFESLLLVSKELYDTLSARSELKISFKGEIPLKGKKLPIGIYSINNYLV